MEKFKLINENFNLVFRELFDGGRAELILVDKENVLESGIEIEVQPPGRNFRILCFFREEKERLLQLRCFLPF